MKSERERKSEGSPGIEEDPENATVVATKP